MQSCSPCSLAVLVCQPKPRRRLAIIVFFVILFNVNNFFLLVLGRKAQGWQQEGVLV